MFSSIHKLSFASGPPLHVVSSPIARLSHERALFFAVASLGRENEMEEAVESPARDAPNAATQQ